MTQPTSSECEACVRAELAGRLYEALDLQLAIDDGRFGSLRAVSIYLGRFADQLYDVLNTETEPKASRTIVSRATRDDEQGP